MPRSRQRPHLYAWAATLADKSQLRTDASRGKEAETLLNSALMVEAFEALEKQYTQAWKDSLVRDTDARERLWQAVQIVGKVKTHLQIVAQNGKLAQIELNQSAE